MVCVFSCFTSGLCLPTCKGVEVWNFWSLLWFHMMFKLSTCAGDICLFEPSLFIIGYTIFLMVECAFLMFYIWVVPSTSKELLSLEVIFFIMVSHDVLTTNTCW